MKQLTPGVTRAVARLGSALRTARIRRRMSQKDVAEVMGISVGTLQRIERGDPGVAIGNIAMAFLCMNCLDKLANVLDPTADELGAVADSLRLPQRVKASRFKQKTVSRESSGAEPISF